MDEIKQDRRDFLVRGLLDESSMDRRDFLGAGLAIGAMGAAGTLALGPEPAHAQAGVGRLTCHALDTYSGRPAGGMRVNLSIQEGGRWKLVKDVMTVDSGRTAEPLMTGDGMQTGSFMLEFFHAEYFKARAFLPNPPFYDRVVHFLNVPSKSSTFHITLVTAPWGYTTFRWKE